MSIAELPVREPPTRKYGDRIVDVDLADDQVIRIADAVYDRRVAVEQKLSEARRQLAEEPDSGSLSAIVGHPKTTALTNNITTGRKPVPIIVSPDARSVLRA